MADSMMMQPTRFSLTNNAGEDRKITHVTVHNTVSPTSNRFNNKIRTTTVPSAQSSQERDEDVEIKEGIIKVRKLRIIELIKICF